MASTTSDPGLVTFLTAEHHRPLTGTKLYCLANKEMCVNNLPRVVTCCRN